MALGRRSDLMDRPRFEAIEQRLLLSASPVISEFLADNARGLEDCDGQTSDWLEIYNPSDTAADLTGWFLTDKDDEPTRWQFPDGLSLGAGEYLVVFASGKDRRVLGQELHTNFKLSADGEYLALIRPDGPGTAVAHAYTPEYPVQTADVSYGLRDMDVRLDTLVGFDEAVSFHVPTPLDDPLDWTDPDFVEDGSWSDAMLVDEAGLVVTEVSTGDVDFVEIQNVSDQAVNTDGWQVLVNDPSGGVNATVPTAWDLSALPGQQAAAGQIAYRTDSTGDHYWGADLPWDLGDAGWVMVIDDLGQVRDFVSWGYTSAQIQAMEVDFGAFTDIRAADQWSGDGAAVGSPGGSDGTMVAFNDHVAGPVTHPNATSYGAQPGGVISGPLKDIATGAPTSVTLTTTAVNSPHFGGQGTWPTVGTDAYETFHGYVDFNAGDYTSIELAASAGQSYSHQFTGLDTADSFAYDFAGTFVRGGSNYLDRWTLVELQGAESAVPAHGTGSGVLVLGPTRVAMCLGDNSAADQGYVARWTDIDPGADGEFTVVESQYTEGAGAGGSKGYGFGAIRLEALSLAPTGYLERIGSFDNNTSVDWVRETTATPGVQDGRLETPFGVEEPNTTGVGFSAGKPAYDTLIHTDVGEDMRSVSPSIRLRVPFLADSPSAYGSLTLRMKYDDGFVAYLNGTEVARRNAPATISHDSAATVARPDDEAVVFEEIDIGSHLGVLRSGANVLAIQGLNVSAGDDDFLIVPEIVASAQMGNLQYMTECTPGEANVEGVPGLGPVIDDLTEDPPQPGENDDLVITAKVTELLDGIADVSLTYRVMYGEESTVPMVDDGSGADAAAGDDLYTGVIPAGEYGAGEMVRWYATAVDDSGQSTRAPLGLSTTNAPEYFGTVVADNVVSGLPVYRWFTADPAAARTRTGTRASIHYLGRFYDNVFVKLRGKNFTKGYRFDFNAGRPFRYSEDAGPVDEFIVNYDHADRKTFVRTPLAYETYRAAGVESCVSFIVRLQRNNAYEGVANYVEQVDNGFVRDHDLDERGTLFKHLAVDYPLMVNAWEFDQQSPKDVSTVADLQAFLDGIHQSGPAKIQYLYDHVDLARFVDYQAASVLVHENDHVAKNYCLYGDLYETGEWWFLPWDKDLTFGLNWGITSYGSVDPQAHPFYGDNDHQKINRQYNYLIDALLDVPQIKQMYLRRLRTLMDELLQPAGTPYGQRYYENRIDQYYVQLTSDPQVLAQLGGASSLSRQLEDIKNKYLGDAGPNGWGRRTHLYVHHAAGSGYADCAGIPAAQVGSPSVVFGAIDFNPVSHNQDEEYIELHNPNTFAVDLSGWRITGEIDYDLRPGTVIASGASLYLTPDALAFRSRATGPSAGQSLYVQGNYDGHLSAMGGTLVLEDAEGEIVAERTYEGNASDVQRHLRITEVNYHPADPVSGSPWSDDDFEFVELRNTSDSQTLHLAGVHFTPDLSAGSGIQYTFGDVDLAPGQFLVLAKNPAAFATRYNMAGLLLAGPYEGALSNGGETLRLYDAVNESVSRIDYDDDGSWPGRADGKGSTLEIIDALGDAGDPDNWRSSREYGGTPGGEGAGNFPSVVVNEVLTHTDPPARDAIELHNPTSSAIDIGGWFLSDSSKDYARFRIPDGTLLPAGGYVVFDESDFNPTPSNPLDNHFALDGAHGEDVWLLSTDAEGNFIHFIDHVEFGAAANAETLGRWPNGGGELYPMTMPTLGTGNSAPRVGPLVISEVHYNPGPFEDPDDLEFIEIHNPTPETVDLTDWRIRGGVDFDFAAGTALPAGESLVVLSFNPGHVDNADKLAAFQAAYGIGPAVALVGGYSGSLSNGGESVKLQRPDEPPLDEPDFVPHLLEDMVAYDDLSPWPASADGGGDSLQRRSARLWGNDPTSWEAIAPSPGEVSFSLLAGDANGDGAVTDADYTIWADNYSAADATWAMGDFNGDARVTDADYTLWADHYGDGVGSAAATSEESSPALITPEPGLPVVLPDRIDETDLLAILSEPERLTG